MNYRNYDIQHILPEHREMFRVLFETIDTDRVVFVGGVADYINLRGSYTMPINDIDLCFREEAHIAQFADRFKMKRFPSLYPKDAASVYTCDCKINGYMVHIDLFKQDSVFVRPVGSSELLGQNVLHTNFEGMKAFHNDYIDMLNSDVKGKYYDWKRLYKHSRKAALYNLIDYRKEKENNTPVLHE